jgi:hypothetical protein
MSRSGLRKGLIAMHRRRRLGLCLSFLLVALLRSPQRGEAAEPAALSSEVRSSRPSPASPHAPSTLRVLLEHDRLRILRQELAGEVELGCLLLPAPTRGAPLLLGRAAYVLLEGQGVVVVDIGVPEDPYIAWHLAKDQAIQSLLLRRDHLLLRVLSQEAVEGPVYDVREPLRPRGPLMQKGAPRRYYPRNSASLKLNGLSGFGAGAPAGRRIHLRSGERLLGRLTASAAPQSLRLVLAEGGGVREFPVDDVLRMEAVYLDEDTASDGPALLPDQAGIQVPLRRQSAGPAAETPLWSSLVDGSFGPLVCRVAGQRLEMLRLHGERETLLGTAALPQPARGAPLLLGPAAYVLLDKGVAVVDVGLARYPYVAWVLESGSEVQSIRLTAGRLELSFAGGTAVYDPVDPLSPSGPDRQRVSRIREYGQSATAADASWVDSPDRTRSGGRRVYLRDGQMFVIWGFSCRASESPCTFRAANPTPSFVLADLLHVEPVDAPEPITTVAPLPPSSSPPPAPPVYRWSQLVPASAARSSYSITGQTAGAAIVAVGGAIALVGGLGALVSATPYSLGPFGGGTLGNSETTLGLGVAAGVGVALVLGGLPILLLSRSSLP